MAGERSRIGLIVRDGPFTDRSGRAQLDLAMTMATLELPLDLFFLGEGAAQLIEQDAELDSSGYPSTARGWNSLPQLTDTRVFVDPDGLALLPAGAGAALGLQEKQRREMAEIWRRCHRLINA